MDGRDESSVMIDGVDAAAIDTSTHHPNHETEDDEDDNEERRTRIMELAQQQEMTIQVLDEVVLNQRNLRDNLASLRRRRRHQDDVDVLGEHDGHLDQPGIDNDADDERNVPTRQHHLPHNQHIRHREGNAFTATQIYFIVSVLFAILAVVTSPTHVGMSIPLLSRMQSKAHTSIKIDVVEGVNHISDDIEKDTMTNNGGGTDKFMSRRLGVGGEKSNSEQDSEEKEEDDPTDLSWNELLTKALENVRDHYKHQYLLLQNFWMYGTLSDPSLMSNSTQNDVKAILSWSWVKKNSIKKEGSTELKAVTNKKKSSIARSHNVSLYSIAMGVINSSPHDVVIKATTIGDKYGASQASVKDETEIKVPVSLSEKILSSTPRLIAIANLLLALVYLIHTAVADLFLGASNVGQPERQQDQQQPQQQQGIAIADEQTRHQRRLGRERLGGFLLFKLLLISSVLDPSTEDVLILFSWYMMLSFLRSLTHLAGSTANRAFLSGQSPRPGTLKLLIAVFICNGVAAIGCIFIFNGAGWHTLLLLTCDSALVAIDTIAHIMKYIGSTMEERHRQWSSSSEEDVASNQRRRRELLEQYRADVTESTDQDIDAVEFDTSMLPIRQQSELEGIESEIVRIQHVIEIRESIHTRLIKVTDVVVFGFELSALMLTAGHYLHIWAIHGASLGLVDFVLALHLHSTISVIGEKISERRSAYKIGAQLSTHFEDASDLDIRKASAAGDVCCICLNSMTIGDVKKVGCGHLFHTRCLKEVVERERSIHTAKCPLCRANLISGRQTGSRAVNNNNAVDETGQQAPTAAAAQVQNNPQLNPADTSLLRFSTEGWLPSWIPVPAFSFEVVRRETPVVAEQNPNPGRWQRFFRRGGQDETNDEDNDDAQPPEQRQQQGGTSAWRRLLILLGFIPMSQEEETIAMEQLVDMFPQYERGDLLRELRARRSAEAVVESILLGVFSGVARGG